MTRLRKALFSGAGLTRLVGIALLAFIILLRISDPVFLVNIRSQTFDLYQRIKPRPYTPQPVAIVDIDEESLAREGQWPWPRTRLADLVLQLGRAGTLATGFDMVFAEPDRLSPPRIAEDNDSLSEPIRAALASLPQNEETFADAISRTRTVVGETGARQASGAEDGPRLVDIPNAVMGQDPTAYLTHFTEVVLNMEPINSAAMGHGVFSVDPDPDGIFRKMPLVMQAEGKLRLALSTEVLRIATGGNAFLLRGNAAGVEGLTVGGVAIPTDRNGKIWPWFSEANEKRYVSASKILDGSGLQDVTRKMVLVGTSSVGLEDYRATPIDPAMPGVEIHAQIIENIISKSFLKRPSYALGMELVLVAVLGLVIIALVPWLSAFFSAGAALFVMAAVAGGSWWAFDQSRILIDPTFPIASALAMFIAVTTGNYIREEVQRRQIRSAFGQYLSPDLVDQLSDDPDRLVLGGETRELSILFTDVRGFTTIAESFKDNPEGLTTLMNRFLTAMSNAILEEDGTIDKYMGDAIMAFWNAPLAKEDHALSACRAALMMLSEVERLNAKRLKEAEEEESGPVHHINIGVGINTGECVVGNMGSELRFDYTCLGDPVNLASRLEGQSKPFGVKVVLGSHTAAAVEETMALLEIDLIRVKGKEEPETIFALIGAEDMRNSQDFQTLKELNDSMIAAYRQQKWKAASTAAGKMAKQAEAMGLDLADYLAVYKTRIANYRKDPPGPDWDAVYVATDK